MLNISDSSAPHTHKENSGYLGLVSRHLDAIYTDMAYDLSYSNAATVNDLRARLNITVAQCNRKVLPNVLGYSGSISQCVDAVTDLTDLRCCGLFRLC